MSFRTGRGKVAAIVVAAALAGAGLSFGALAFASGPANGTQVPGSALPIGTHTPNSPFSSGQTIEVKIPTNSDLQPGARVNILECSDPGGTVANLPSDISSCDGRTIQGDTVLVNSDGSVDYTDYTLYALPDALSLGESPTSTPVCNLTNECVLFIGEDQNNFTGAPYYFSQPFFVAPNSDDGGENPGDGSAQTPQAITFTSTAPSPGFVGGTYTPTATGGASGNPVVFSIDGSSTAGACSVSSGVVSFAGTGTCVIDANQAGTSAYSAAPQVSQSVTVQVSPANGTQIPGSALPVGTYTPHSPFSSGQTIEVKIPANADLQSGARVNILECSDPGGTAGNLPTDISGCDGKTIQGDTVLVHPNGGVDYTDYTLYALPDSVSLGESAASTPVCNLTSECVLFVGEDQNNFAGAPYYFSQPFLVAPNSSDRGANPGDGSAQTPQAITFTSHPPTPADVGGTYTPTATGGASGNPVVFSIGASSTAGACTLSAGVVHFNGAGTCVIDANQAGNAAYTAAPTVAQSVTIGFSGPAITSANHTTATVGEFFTFHVTTTGGSPKIKGKGKLAKGVKFVKGTGSATITGTPTSTKHKSAAGNYQITITATFGKGKTKQVVTQLFTLQVGS